MLEEATRITLRKARQCLLDLEVVLDLSWHVVRPILLCQTSLVANMNINELPCCRVGFSLLQDNLVMC